NIASLWQEFIGKLSMVSPAADPRTRVFPLQVTLSNDDLLIKPGMFAEVELKTEAVSDVLVIPRSAIMQEGSRQVVYTVKEDKAYVQEISLGLVNDRIAEVTAGLDEGDLLVVKGQQYLRDGMPVSVVAGGEGQ
ncbi:MAG: efflux RND transporter periplasmic adaptor subunit, partial [bacterium]